MRGDLVMLYLPCPISVVDSIGMCLNLKAMQNKFLNYYAEYQDDLYLLHRNRIDYIKQFVEIPSDDIYNDIYFDFSSLNLENHILTNVINFKSYRKRLISKYLVTLDKNRIERVDSGVFAQSLALVDDDSFDYRKMDRVFKELPDALFDDDLRKIIFFVLNKIRSFTGFSNFQLIVHHTFIFCENANIATNSPEGVHQDGMDFIMSAFVVERKNVKGAKSIIYGGDKKNKLFECTLKDGQGILQADLNTDLWHEVTEISQIDLNEMAYRSSIGFDVKVLQ